jgi:pimeloyl-ACP methyl ester carboxylesterase
MKRILGLTLALSVLTLAYGPFASAHWPGQPEHQFAQLGDLQLEGGGVIKNLRMSYVTHGKLNAAKDNAILFMHGYGANHHSGDHLIGPGRPLDTEKYFIICSDSLGATQTTFEHSTSPTNSGLKMKFPFYNGRDRVRAEYKLVTEGLGIPHLFAISGISDGAYYSVQFAVSYPDFMDGIFPISGGARAPRGSSLRLCCGRSSSPVPAGMKETTTTTQRSAQRTRSRYWCRISTVASGGSSTSTRQRLTQSGAIPGGTGIWTFRMPAISTMRPSRGFAAGWATPRGSTGT